MTPIGFTTMAVKGLRQKNVQMGISYDSFISLVNRSKPKKDSSVLQVSSQGSWLSAQRIVSFDLTAATMTVSTLENRDKSSSILLLSSRESWLSAQRIDFFDSTAATICRHLRIEKTLRQFCMCHHEEAGYRHRK